MRANVVTSLSEVTMLLSVHKDMPTPTAASPSTELTTPEVVVLDASHAEVEEIAAIIADIAVLRATRIVHLFVRTAETLHRAMAADDSQPRRALLRCAKPVRPLPLLRLLAQARAEARLPPPPLPPPPPPPPSATPSILINAVNYAQAGGQERPSAAGQIRKAISAPAVPKKGGATPKLVDHFSAEQLEHFKSIHILIAEGERCAFSKTTVTDRAGRQPCRAETSYVSSKLASMGKLTHLFSLPPTPQLGFYWYALHSVWFCCGLTTIDH